MEQTLNYYPNGKIIRDVSPVIRNNLMTDKRFVRYTFRGNNLLVGSTTLEDKQGEISLGDDDWMAIPIEDNILPWFALEGDTLIVTLSNTVNNVNNVNKILVINLDTRQYEEYQGLDETSYPLGIDGDIIYLVYDSTGLENYGRTIIVALNVKTREIVFEYPIAGLLNNRSMHKIYDGSRVIERSDVIIGDRIHDIISVPDGEVHLRIEGNIKGTLITQYGVFYVSEDGKRYYSTFDGETYLVNSEADQVPERRYAHRLIAASDDAQSIWDISSGTNYKADVVNYRLPMPQKSARF